MNIFASLTDPLKNRPGVSKPKPTSSVTKARTTKATAAKKNRIAAPPNPWGVTGMQAKALDAIARTGSTKKAAFELGLSHRTIEAHCARAKDRMGLETSFQAVLEWDRHTRLFPVEHITRAVEPHCSVITQGATP